MKTLPISLRGLLLALSMLVGVAGLSGSQAMASTLTVNTTADNTTCDNFLTLREAILMGQGSFTRALTFAEAAQISGATSVAGPPSPGCPGMFGYTFGTVGTNYFDNIFFTNAVTTISPASQLPKVHNSDQVIGLKPDGTKVILSGSSAGASSGLVFTSGGPAAFNVGGADSLIITNFANAGIVVEGTRVFINNSLIRNNGGAGIYALGMDVANGFVDNPSADIADNFIFSNGGNGILFQGRFGNTETQCGSVIVNNYIGYRDTTLTTNDGNGSDGIKIANCTYIRIGVDRLGTDGRNYIGGSNADGIQLTGAKTYGNRIVNNIIGKSSSFAGGGFGNGFSGIAILNGAGLTPAALFAPNQIGEPNKPNVISGNGISGIYLSDPGSSAIISNNYIGTNLGANTDLGNGGDGVSIHTSATAYVGGDELGEGNVIAFNARGVLLASSAGNANIRRNRIFENDQLGIDLNGDGVTANDLNDGDTGPNGLQNYPVLTSVSGGSSSTTVTGSFNSSASRNYIIAFFGNTSCDPSGYGEGRTFLGELSAATNATGNATLNAVIPIGISSAGSFVTATALDTSTGQTSEFSQCQPVGCSYSLASSSANVGSGASSGSFQLTTTTGCGWTATSNAAWITITGGMSGNGNGTVSYSIAANTGVARTGTITVGGQTFTINQAAGCTYSLSHASASYPTGGISSDGASVFAGVGCTWTAASSSPWINIISGSSGSGNGSVSWSVAANVGPARTGTLTIAGSTFTVNQASGCNYSLSQPSINFPATGGNYSTPITAAAGCAWTATSNAAWITTSSSGSGNGSFQYVIQANTGASRTGTITVGGQTFTANQAAPGRPTFDFDGDRKTDLSIFRPNGAASEWWWSKSSTGGNGAVQFGASTDKIVPADYTGDGKTDVAFWRPSTGQWFVLRSEDFSFFAFPFGNSTDVPVPADYDGDGKADAAVFRESNLTWYINKSTGGTQNVGFGSAGDRAVPADYDGDGKADIAIYRPNAAGGAQWWIQRSSNGSVFATQFGASTDKTVQGDFTGDGKADIAFFRPSTGFWNVLRSEDLSFFAFPFGTTGDVPVPGDYDGDGKSDAGVFRPSNSTWFVQRSTAGTLIQQFGITGDLPLPNAFVR